MKILQILASNSGMGGLEQHTINLCNALAEQHEVHLIAHASYKDLLDPRIQLYCVDWSRSRLNPFLHYELIQLVRKIQPDILHAQANKAASLLAPWLKYLKCRNVATIHNIKKNIQPFLKFDRIIAVSQKIADHFPVHTSVDVIWNGTNIQRKGQVSPSRQRPHALAIGRLVSAKGFDILIEAWQQIDADLWIAGEGIDRQLLEDKIKQYQLNDRIQLLGLRQDVPELLENADCLIISSRNEGGPITLAEALLLRTPVLSTSVGMVSSFLTEELMCVPASVDSLSTLLQAKLKLKTQMQAEFEPIFKRAEQQLTFKNMVSSTVHLYETLLK